MKFPGGGGDTGNGYGLLLTSAVLLLTLSTLITFCYPVVETSDNLTIDSLSEQYYNFTGSNPTSESIWCLSGIYTAYGSDENGDPYTGYGYTSDGWLYGVRVVNYTPSQYSDTTAYTSRYDADNNCYVYTDDSITVNKHGAGDLYGSVVMDVGKKSDIFFTQNNKVNVGFSNFYYEFSGGAYRYAFQPVTDYYTADNDGNQIIVTPNKSSLSLIWYDYYGSGNSNVGGSGLAGQLIISNDYGVAYLTSAQIVSAFNSNTSTSKFTMTFNGVDMNIYIKLDPNKLAGGLTVEECYNLGFWSVMVSSISVNTDSVISSDYEFNPYSVFQTMVSLLTFNTSDYGLTGMAGTLASIVIVVPLMVGLLVLGLNNYLILILAGIYGVLSAWSWGLF